MEERGRNHAELEKNLLYFYLAGNPTHCLVSVSVLYDGTAEKTRPQLVKATPTSIFYMHLTPVVGEIELRLCGCEVGGVGTGTPPS